MLKYLYKTLVISILCGSILMLDMSYKSQSLHMGISTARAETLSTGGGSDSNLMATLTMVGISVIASRLIQYGLVTTDVMLAAAGGLAFIAGDMMATSKLKEAMKKIQTEIERKENGDLSDQQRQSLIKLKQSYLDAKEAATTKKNMQLAAAAAFAAAAVVAYMQAGTELAAETACQTAITSAISGGIATALAACMAPCAAMTVGAAACVEACEAEDASCSGAVGSVATGFNSYVLLRKAPQLSCPALAEVNTARTTLGTGETSLTATCPMTFEAVGAAVQTACSPVIPLHMGYETGCLSPMILYAGMAASVLLTGITAATLVTAVVGFSTELSTMVDTAIFMPMRRAIMWGALAALSYMASSATDQVIAQLEGDIAKIDALLNTINGMSSGNNTAGANNGTNGQTTTALGNNSTTINSNNTNGVDLGANDAKLPCITEEKGKSGCPSFKSKFNLLPMISGLPTGLGNSIDNIVKMADGLNGSSKVSGSTFSAAGALAAGSNAVKAMLDKQRQATQVKSLNNVNYLNEEAKMLKAMTDASSNALAKNKLNTKEAYASLGGGISDNSAMDSINAKGAAGATDALAALKKANSAKLTAIMIPSATPSKNKFGDLKLEDEKAKKDEVAAKDNKTKTTMDDYDLKNEINSDKGPSIFEVISSRYQKSGYPRLFKRIQE